MRTIIYGYKMVDGRIAVDEAEAEQVRKAFRIYLDGSTLSHLGQETGINRNHSAMNNLLKDARYKGNDIYPRIVDDDLFEQVTKKRAKEISSRTWGRKRKELPMASTQFTMDKPEQKYTDPFLQAQFIYGLIKAKEE